MQAYPSEKIRNVALIGHGGCGKTSLMELALFETGVTNRVGTIEDGNTVSDYDKMEIEKGHSINMSIIPIEYKDVKINFIDTPGLLDFSHEMYSAIEAADMALLIVDAGSGVQVGTEKAWDFCKTLKKPTFIMIKRKDKDTYDFNELVSSIQERFGAVCVPASYPIKPEMLEALNEMIAETDEELMNKYFDEGVFEDWEFNKGLRNGVAAADIVPIFAFDPENGQGVSAMLDIIRKFAPSPLRHTPYLYVDASGGEDYALPETDGPVTALVFKTLSDPFVGKFP